MVDDPSSDESAPPPDDTWESWDTWSGLRATTLQAMEWGIDLCGQLATVHAEGVVIGDVGPHTIRRNRFGQPRLPEPDTRATHEPWVDVAGLADAIRSIVPDPPTELLDALLPPYASAVALGQELQDAQRALGAPVAPIPFEGAPLTRLGGRPVEVPPFGDERSDDDDPSRMLSDLGFDPGQLSQTPNLLALFAVAMMVGIAALAIGVGWR